MDAPAAGHSENGPGKAPGLMRLILLPLSLWFLVACLDRRDAPTGLGSELTAFDSAGVEIILMGSSRAAVPVNLGDPVHRTGWTDGGAHFQVLRHGRLLPDGSVLVSDAVSDWIYRLDAELNVLDSLGGTGEGPGEFESVASVAALSSDSIVVYDLTQDRITGFFDTTVVTRQIDGERPGVYHSPSGVMPDGRIFWGAYGISPRRLRQGPLEADVLIGDPWGESLDTVATLFYEEIVDVGGPLQRRPFGTKGFMSSSPEGFVWSSNARPEIRWFTPDGELYRILRWSEDSEALDDEYWENFVEVQVRVYTTEVRFPLPEDLLRDRFAQWPPVLPETLPAFQESWVGADGYIWFKRRPPLGSDESDYLVVSPDGRCMRSLIPPPRFTFMDSRDGRVLGREMNEWGAHSAVLYELRPCLPPDGASVVAQPGGAK